MTIKDLARTTGYGVATVSRVLNNHPNVSEKARKKILRAAKESNFQINTNAKQLKQTSSNSILAVVKGTSNEMFGSLVENIQNRIVETKYPLIVDYIDEDANEVLRAITLCREKKPLGILFLGGNRENFIRDFERIDIPCVLVSNSAKEYPFPNLSSVSTDDKNAAKCAAEHLIALGHKSIVMVGGSKDISDTARLRFEGFAEACAEKEIPFDEKTGYEGVRFSYSDGYEATRRLIERNKGFTALFAAADVMAIGAIRALRDSGLRVPEDVSVVGFDGLAISSFLVPKLSTVEQSVEKMAERSVGILLDNIENGGSSAHETVPFTMRSMESSKALN